jgi:hypothetical protein
MTQGNPNGVRNGVMRLSIVVDAGMIIGLVTLIYWVGSQAQQVKNLSQNMATMQGQVLQLSATQNRDDSVARLRVLEVENINTKKAIEDMRSDLVARLTRIENKQDRSR